MGGFLGNLLGASGGLPPGDEGGLVQALLRRRGALPPFNPPMGGNAPLPPVNPISTMPVPPPDMIGSRNPDMIGGRSPLAPPPDLAPAPMAFKPPVDQFNNLTGATVAPAEAVPTPVANPPSAAPAPRVRPRRPMNSPDKMLPERRVGGARPADTFNTNRPRRNLMMY